MRKKRAGRNCSFLVNYEELQQRMHITRSKWCFGWSYADFASCSSRAHYYKRTHNDFTNNGGKPHPSPMPLPTWISNPILVRALLMALVLIEGSSYIQEGP